MDYRLSATGREARIDVVSDSGERVGYVVADVYDPAQVLGYGACAADVATLLDRYRASPKVLVVTASYLDYGIRSVGVGTAMYDALVRGAGDYYQGPVLVVPDGCWTGSTSESAQRVWSKLRKTWDSAGSVIAAVPVISGKLTRPYAGDPEAIAFLQDSRAETTIHERAAIKPGKTVGLLLGGTANYRRVVLVDVAALKRGDEPADVLIGELSMKALKGKSCRSDLGVPAYSVATAIARPGWGPALYDTALTVATHEGYAGVIPDRLSLSTEARGVWAFYANRRPDVGRITAKGCPMWGDPELDMIYAPVKPKGLVDVDGMASRAKEALKIAARVRKAHPLELEVELFEEAADWFIREYNKILRGEKPKLDRGDKPKRGTRMAALPLSVHKGASWDGAVLLEGTPEQLGGR